MSYLVIYCKVNFGIIYLHTDIFFTTLPVIITSLAKEVMFLVALVCVSVCLSVDNITQNVMNGLE